MAISVKHRFVSAKGDGTDATLVRPSNWNDTHDVQMAANNVLGRLTAGTGSVEEIPATAYMLGLLNTADYATLAAALGLFTTGDAKLTYKTVADVGWVMANDGTIGDTSSGATTASNTTQALFTFFYNNFSDAVCPVQTSAGGATTRVAQGTATVAYNAHCRMVIPKTLGRAIIVSGTGAGLTARALATTGGEENHLLTTNEIPAHTHAFTNSTGSGSGTTTLSSGAVSVSGTFGAVNTSVNSVGHTHTYSGTTGAMNANASHTHNFNNAGVGVTSTVYTTYTLGYNFASAGSQGFQEYATTIVATNTDHGHAYSGTTSDISQNHTHSLSGITLTSSGTIGTGGTCSVTSVTVSGTTNNNVTTGSSHNVMQPWTAWNVMIKL